MTFSQECALTWKVEKVKAELARDGKFERFSSSGGSVKRMLVTGREVYGLARSQKVGVKLATCRVSTDVAS